MTRFLKLGLIGVAAPATIGVPALVHYIKQPTNFGERLTWNGGTHLGQGDDQKNTWKAKFNDYGEYVKSVVTDYTSGDPTDEHIGKLKGWCATESSKDPRGEKYERYESLCSTDIVTQKGKLISEGLSIASEVDDWKLLFINNKHISSFIGDLNGNDGQSIAASTGVDTGYPSVKKLCEGWFQGPYDPGTYPRVKARCVKSTIQKVGEKLGRVSGFQKITDESLWEKAHGKWKNEANYSTTVRGSGSSDGNTQVDGNKLKSWCNESMDKKLVDLTNYDEDIQRIRSYCDATGLATTQPGG